METLRVAPGLVAVHAARLIMVCAVKPAGKVTVRDLASGEVSEIAVGELSARPPTIRENDGARLHADVVRGVPLISVQKVTAQIPSNGAGRGL